MKSQLHKYFESDSNIKHIVIYGSVARNEHLVKYEPHGASLVNDIDILVLVDDIKKYMYRLKNDISYFESYYNTQKVDIVVKRDSEDLRKHRSIWHFDLTYAFTTVYGNKNLFEKKLAQYRQSDIRSFDVFNMFITRSWAVLATLTSLGSEESVNYQKMKALLAILDIKLLSRNLYSPFIEKKLNTIADSQIFTEIDKVAVQEIRSIRDHISNSGCSKPYEADALFIYIQQNYREAFHTFLRSRSLPRCITQIYSLKYILIGLFLSMRNKSFSPLRYRFLMLMILILSTSRRLRKRVPRDLIIKMLRTTG